MKRWLPGFGVAVAAATAVGLACGPFLFEFQTVKGHVPAFIEAYSRGDLGVVKPGFPRRYLAQAYRVMNGRPAVRAGAYTGRDDDPVTVSRPSASGRWAALVERLQGRALSPQERWQLTLSERVLPNYASFGNCLDDAYANAERTLNARVVRYGAASREVADWLAAQLAVFRNCSGSVLVLPPAAPPWADPLLRADRDYQIAAAHFYGMAYDRAVVLFRAMAEDVASPWQASGRYLAARALIRGATVPENPPARARELLAAADAELRLVLDDPAARPLHASARELLDFVAARLRPADQLLVLARRLAEADAPSQHDVTDYRALMDSFVGETSTFAFEPGDRIRIVAADLVDWTETMQGRGDDPAAHAIDVWRRTRSPHWLVAAMWRVPPQHDAAPALLQAAAAIAPDSPAFSTVASLRVRLLLQRGDRANARALLADLPAESTPAVNREVLNILRAARLAVADSLDEFLQNASRFSLENQHSDYQGPVFDEDVAAVLNHMLSLDRVVDAALSGTLPSRLRVRVAAAAFTRAIVLHRPEAARRVAPVLGQLAPQLREDVDRYLAATDETTRHRRGVLLLLRTPGMRAFVIGLDDDWLVKENAPPRTFHPYGFIGRSWWCAAPERSSASSELINLLYGSGGTIPVPAFLSDEERARAAEERAAFARAGDAREYLAREALTWARAARGDAEIPEVLARTVNGWRRSCRSPDAAVSNLPRQAFTLLHRQFPGSGWAKRTPYWYQ